MTISIFKNAIGWTRSDGRDIKPGTYTAVLLSDGLGGDNWWIKAGRSWRPGPRGATAAAQPTRESNGWEINR